MLAQNPVFDVISYVAGLNPRIRFARETDRENFEVDAAIRAGNILIPSSRGYSVPVQYNLGRASFWINMRDDFPDTARASCQGQVVTYFDEAIQGLKAELSNNPAFCDTVDKLGSLVSQVGAKEISIDDAFGAAAENLGSMPSIYKRGIGNLFKHARMDARLLHTATHNKFALDVLSRWFAESMSLHDNTNSHAEHQTKLATSVLAGWQKQGFRRAEV